MLRGLSNVRLADGMAETDWARLGLETNASLLSGVGGLIVGAWKWGRNSVRAEHAIKDDYNSKIRALREEVRTSMASQAQKSADENDLLVSQFKESFEGMRRQIDEHRFYTEKDFVKKEDFRDFREEYRDDMRDLKVAIASILRK